MNATSVDSISGPPGCLDSMQLWRGAQAVVLSCLMAFSRSRLCFYMSDNPLEHSLSRCPPPPPPQPTAMPKERCRGALRSGAQCVQLFANLLTVKDVPTTQIGG